MHSLSPHGCSCGKSFPPPDLCLYEDWSALFICSGLLLMPEGVGQRASWNPGWHSLLHPVWPHLCCSPRTSGAGGTLGIAPLLPLPETVPTPPDHLSSGFCFSQEWRWGAVQELKAIPLNQQTGAWVSPKSALQAQQFVTISEQGCYQLPATLLHTEVSPGASPPAKVWDPAEFQIPLLHIIALAELSPELPV